MNNLNGILREEAIRHGAIPFARFMELALYCPNFGYYEQMDASPGRRGDYFTSVSVGNLFGELLAFQFANWLARLPVQRPRLMEAGAHDGRLALDILRWIDVTRPGLRDSLEYWILEPSARRRQSQEKTLSAAPVPVRWFESWDTLPPPGVNGIIFSNELLDAMPVHRVGWDAVRKEWFEWGVSLQGDTFVWARMPLARETLAEGGLTELPQGLLEVLPDGFTTEIGLAASRWWHQAARVLRSGKLVAIDYGMTAEQFLVPERKHGTLRAYHHHRASSELLARPGEQDLTSHVNFSLVRQAGEAEGLTTETFESQGQFLSGQLRKIEENRTAFGQWTAKHSRQFQTLTHPEHLGRAFRVLVQSR